MGEMPWPVLATPVALCRKSTPVGGGYRAQTWSSEWGRLPSVKWLTPVNPDVKIGSCPSPAVCAWQGVGVRNWGPCTAELSSSTRFPPDLAHRTARGWAHQSAPVPSQVLVVSAWPGLRQGHGTPQLQGHWGSAGSGVLGSWVPSPAVNLTEAQDPPKGAWGTMLGEPWQSACGHSEPTRAAPPGAGWGGVPFSVLTSEIHSADALVCGGQASGSDAS